MTQEQKNEKIAETCGYKIGYRDPEVWHPLPNYFEDLNAMHEAEKTIKVTDKWRVYKYTLNLMPIDDIHATAAQRAEAFGKTLNLW